MSNSGGLGPNICHGGVGCPGYPQIDSREDDRAAPRILTLLGSPGPPPSSASRYLPWGARRSHRSGDIPLRAARHREIGRGRRCSLVDIALHGRRPEPRITGSEPRITGGTELQDLAIPISSRHGITGSSCHVTGFSRHLTGTRNSPTRRRTIRPSWSGPRSHVGRPTARPDLLR